MIKLTSAVILGLIIVGVSCDTTTESIPTTTEGNTTVVGDLPPSVIQDIIAIFTHGVVNLTTNCLNATAEDLNFLLYTRTHNNTPISINISNPTQIDQHKKIIVIIHGWQAGPSSNGLPDLIQAYLIKYDCNVIALDWSKFTYQSYGLTYCTVKGVANIVADFLCYINSTMNVTLDSTHVLGHSIGAQMAGFIGTYTNQTCNASIGRITGLDPAGPGYQGVSVTERLDALDAIFVDIIHTNQLEYGYAGNCGDADFYVNCALLQPGCLAYDIENILNTSLEVLNCSHMRSIDYFAEGVNSNNFTATECLSCPLVCLPKPIGPKHTVMGESCPANTTGGFLLTTNASPPYARG